MRRRIPASQGLLLDPSYDLVELIIDIEDVPTCLCQQGIAFSSVIARVGVARATRQLTQGVDFASDGGDAPGMGCSNLSQILIETRLCRGGILLGAGELRDGQV